MNQTYVLAVFTLVFSILTTLSATPPDPREHVGLTKQIIAELNRVRANPKAYAAYLVRFRRCYRPDGTLRIPGRCPMRTQEGVIALDEAIRELIRTNPLPPLTRSDILTGSARALMIDQSQSGAFGHGSMPFERMARCGVTNDVKGENVAYGARTAEGIVYNLVVDDGVRDRGHRRNVLTTEFHEAGVSYGSHPRYGVMCVIDFAGGFGR